MAAVTFDPSRQIDLYFRVNRAGSRVINFVTPSGAAYDVSNRTFEFVVKDFYGNTVFSVSPVVSSNQVTVSVTANQTNIAPAKYYWQLNITDRTWLNGGAYFHSNLSTQ